MINQINRFKNNRSRK